MYKVLFEDAGFVGGCYMSFVFISEITLVGSMTAVFKSGLISQEW